MFLCACMLSLHSGTHLGVELLDLMVFLCLKLFSKVAAPCHILIGTSHKGPRNLSTSSPTFVPIHFVYFVIILLGLMCLDPKSLNYYPWPLGYILAERGGTQQWLLCGCSNRRDGSGCDGVGLQCQRHSPSRVRRPRC